MTLVVADASAILEYLLQTDKAGGVSAVMRSRDSDLAVPALCDIEVAAGLRRGVIRKLMDVGRAELALKQYLDLPLTRYGHSDLLTRVFELRTNFGAYDACYVALAERLRAALMTADKALARAVSSHTSLALIDLG